MKLIGPFSQIVTLEQLPQKGALHDDQLQVVEAGGVLCEGTQIKAIGSFDALSRQSHDELETIEGAAVLLPGFLDSHTHLCFGGKRQRDYALRIAGKSYLDIAKAGGGIWDTVQQTRQASFSELTNGLTDRLRTQLTHGITTCEVKSGYGLSVEEELKMLKVIRVSRSKTPADLVATCLAAHTLPRDFSGTNEAYLSLIIDELLPQIRKEQLANRVDIFIEEGAFTPEEGKKYLHAARQMGFDLTIHGDQFHPGGSTVAVELGAQSVDHLESSTEKEIKGLSKSDVVGTALPGASLGLGCPFTPARQLLDQGGCLAIASDWNPGSAPMGDLVTQAAILSTMQKLSTAETLAGLTFRAAKALGLKDRGRLEAGYLADMQAYPSDDYRDILYYQGQLKPHMVWKNGEKVHG